jgi:hypothetical protein
VEHAQRRAIIQVEGRAFQERRNDPSVPDDQPLWPARFTNRSCTAPGERD